MAKAVSSHEHKLAQAGETDEAALCRPRRPTRAASLSLAPGAWQPLPRRDLGAELPRRLQHRQV